MRDRAGALVHDAGNRYGGEVVLKPVARRRLRFGMNNQNALEE
jgi:hypothetical protein